jgi:hypothetical protein
VNPAKDQEAFDRCRLGCVKTVPIFSALIAQYVSVNGVIRGEEEGGGDSRSFEELRGLKEKQVLVERFRGSSKERERKVVAGA